MPVTAAIHHGDIGGRWLGGRLAGIAALAMSLVLALAPEQAVAAGNQPILTLDTGGHMAVIRDIQFTPDGRRIVSASDDKTVRIWNLSTGKTERIIRGEIGDGDNGKALSLAISPDGSRLAVGGMLSGTVAGASTIRLYDLASGDLLAILQGHTDGVLTLAFSPDGTTLASGSMDDTAILWSMVDFQARHRLKGHGGDVNGVRFDPAGSQLLTASDDGTVKRWKFPSGKLIGTVAGHQGVVFDVAVSAANARAYSAGLDRTIRSFDAGSGGDPRGFVRLPAPVYALSISPDGKVLLAAEGAAPYHARLIDAATGAVRVDYAGHDGILTAAVFSPDGRLAATAGGSDNAIEVWEAASGKLVRRLAGDGESIWAVAIDQAGGQIAWGSRKVARKVNGYGPLQQMLRLPVGDGSSLGEPKRLEEPAQVFSGPLVKAGDLQLDHRVDPATGYIALLDILKNGKARATIVHGESNGVSLDSYTFRPRSAELVAGAGHGVLAAYDLRGRKLRDYIGHTSDVWSVAASADGRILLSGSDDQTLRLWNAATGENVVSLFVAKSGEWVMWTPQGYFAASPGGDSHVGWHINGGFAKPARFVSAAQLKRHFYRPDVVRDAIVQLSAKAAIDKAKVEAFDLDELIRRRPPELRFAGIDDGKVVAASPFRVTVEVEAGNDPLESLELKVDGRLVSTTNFDDGDSSRRTIDFDVPLGAGANRVEVVANNAVGRTIESITIGLDGTGEFDQRGTLFIIAVGVDDYPALGQNLEYAGLDAKALAKKIAETGGPLHQRVETLVLTNGGETEPSAINVLKAFKLLQQAQPNDTVVLFLAGHGVNDGADYLFLPSDAKLNGEKWRPETVIKWQTLQRLLEITKGRRIMLVDTCHSGNAYNARLIKDAADASIVVYTATDADTLALEKPELAHGVFTYSVLAGLDGKADASADNAVSALELSGFLDRQVRVLTGGKQAPVFYATQKDDFVIGRQ